MHRTSSIALDTARSGRRLEGWACLASATAIVAYGLSRRSASGTWMAVAATPLAYRGLTGAWPRVRNGHRQQDTRTALAGERGIHVREAIRLEKPIDEVYRFWRQLANLPRIMSHIEEVTDLGGGRSHWVAKGVAGVNVEWDAEIINAVENQVIGWRSLPGSDIVTAGAVNFDVIGDGRSTQVTVHLQYAPPVGRAGALIATLIGREPSQTIREDLRRFKQLLEAGETTNKMAASES
jgi:uncharacterized membrane protein